MDQEFYKKEEQRRFEILDAHWDLPIKDVTSTPGDRFHSPGGCIKTKTRTLKAMHVHNADLVGAFRCLCHAKLTGHGYCLIT